MLVELRASNFGIIEQINWQPGQGLNVVTGETGTGKSLVIDAIDTLLSARSDESSVRHGADSAFIEVVFDISDQSSQSALSLLLDENGLIEPEENSLVISGEIKRQGRSAFRVNGKTVSRSLLKNIGSLLVDIHGQSEHLSLLNKDSHLDFLDAYAHTVELRSRFGAKATTLRQTEQELKTLTEQEKEQTRQEEFLSFQIDELKRADLQEGEEEELEKHLTLLSSSEKLKAAAYEAYQSLYGDDDPQSAASALEKLGEASAAIQRLTDMDDSLKSLLDYTRELENGLADVARDVRGYGDGIEYDPRQLEEIETRLGLIRDLKRKYGQNITEMLKYLEESEEKLVAISNSGERKQYLEQEIDSLKRELGASGEELSGKRIKASKKMIAAVEGELSELNMTQVRFVVDITNNENVSGIPLSDGRSVAFNRDGIDNVEFHVSTNPGEPFKPLTAIASTGEISRFMLALKSALAEADNIPLLIFDEIDIGVGGRSGEVVGRKLWNLALRRQTFCITHLPQIAVFADFHYSVQKQSEGERTTTNIVALQGKDRISELAEMLSGPQHTAVAIENVVELAGKAEAWKKSAQTR